MAIASCQKFWEPAPSSLTCAGLLQGLSSPAGQGRRIPEQEFKQFRDLGLKTSGKKTLLFSQRHVQ